MSELQMKLYLLIHDGIPRRVPLEEGTITLGRSRGCHVKLDDPHLSRQHCALTVDEGRIVVADLGSSNGTFVGGESVEVRDLCHGDVIELGSVCLLPVTSETDLTRLDRSALRNLDRLDELVELAAEKIHNLPSAGDDLQRSAGRAPQLLADIATDHLVDELVSLLIRSHSVTRNALSKALDRMIGEQLLEKSADVASLRAAVKKIVVEEIESSGIDGGAEQ